jgi:hypothetical protein
MDAAMEATMRYLALLSLVLVCGCASYSGSSLKPGISTQADTRAVMGAPYAVHPAPPGAGYAESWEYPHGPMGRQTYMARFDTQGRLLRIDQVLDVRNVQALSVGVSTRDDVRDLFGRPGYVTPRNFQGRESWDYFAKDGVRRIIIGVTFDEHGRVLAAGEVADPEETSPIRGRR